MKIPYNKVHVRGQILFAARGGAIHTFNLTDGAHISSWKHPDVDKVADSIKAINEAKAEAALEAEANTPATESDGPPAKRQKLGGENESALVTAGAGASTPTAAQDDKPRSGHFDGRGKKGKGKAGKDIDNGKTRFARVPDRPVITHLTTSSDGSHLLAVSGHDKVVWVFKHDGNGQIEELSQRYERLLLLLLFTLRKRHVLNLVYIELCLNDQVQSPSDLIHKSSAQTSLAMSTLCL